MSVPKFSVSEALKFGWKTLKENIGFLAAVGAVAALPDFLFGVIPGRLWVHPLFRTLLPLLINIAFSIGMTKMVLALHDSGRKDFADFWGFGPYYYKYLLAQMIPALSIGGLTLLAVRLAPSCNTLWKWALLLFLTVVPSIYLAIRYLFVSYVVVDQGKDFDSVEQSWSITEGSVGRLLLLVLILYGIPFLVHQALNWTVFISFAGKGQKTFWLVSYLALFGQVFLLPFQRLATVYVYRKLEHPSTEAGTNLSPSTGI